MKLDPNDQRLLAAAEGWLGLGDWQEANEELERIRPEMGAHPRVLRVRWEIYGNAGKWEMAAEVARGMTSMLPDNSWGWILLGIRPARAETHQRGTGRSLADCGQIC